MGSSRYNNGLAGVSLHTKRRAAVTVSEDFGPVAQSVEQRTENPCVGGSIPPRATSKYAALHSESRFYLCAGVTPGLHLRENVVAIIH